MVRKENRTQTKTVQVVLDLDKRSNVRKGSRVLYGGELGKVDYVNTSRGGPVGVGKEICITLDNGREVYIGDYEREKIKKLKKVI